MRHLAFVSLVLSTAALTACKQENSGYCPDGMCGDGSIDSPPVACNTPGVDLDDCENDAPVCGADNLCGPCTMDEQCDGRPDTVCGGGACVECDEEGTQAAMPNSAEDECQTPGQQVCDATTQTCRACAVGTECASDVCDNGMCIDEDTVAYVEMNGPGSTCTSASPCPKVADAIDTGRPYILVRGGEYDGALDFNGDNATVFAAGATFRRSMNGRVLHVHGGGGGSTVTIYGGTFDGQGGDAADVVYVDSGSRLTLDGVTVTRGEGLGIGSMGTLTLRRTTVIGNNGIGVSVNNSATPFEMVSSKILTSRENGLTVTAQRATIVNNVIAKNGYDGTFPAIRINSLSQPEQSQVEFNTIAGNLAVGATTGGAVTCSAATVTLRNSIIHSNGGVSEVSGCTVLYSTVEGMAKTTNNVVDIAPVFIDTGSANNFHLAPGSPLRGLADPATPTGAALFDMDGQPRPAPAGGAPDLGADEIE